MSFCQYLPGKLAGLAGLAWLYVALYFSRVIVSYLCTQQGCCGA
jgi:hypothetical protein